MYLSSAKQWLEKLLAKLKVAKLNQLTKNQKVFLSGFFGFFGLVLLLSLAFGVYRAYAKVKTDRFTVAVATVLRLPIAKVNGERVLYSDYVDDLRAITVMRDYDKANNGQAASLTDENLTDQVLFRQVNNILIGELARKNNVKAEPSDIEKIKSGILEKDFKTIENARKAIMDRYGWTLEVFEKKVIVPFVLQSKLAEKIKADPSAREALRVKAQGVLDQVSGGADFAAMAQKYGEDGTAAKGGELGWFGKGEMVPAFENAAFALKKGELSPVLVESPYGFHILQVEDTKTEKVKDEKGKAVSKSTVKARHILFMFPSSDKELSANLKNANIKIYSRVHNPFAELLKQAGK